MSVIGNRMFDQSSWTNRLEGMTKGLQNLKKDEDGEIFFHSGGRMIEMPLAFPLLGGITGGAGAYKTVERYMPEADSSTKAGCVLAGLVGGAIATSLIFAALDPA